MKRIHFLAAALFSLAAACAPSTGSPASGSAASGSAQTHVVEIHGMAFTPAALDVAVGDTVTWINHDVVPHTATAEDGAWDSGSLKQGAEWSLVVKASGPVDYRCAFHPQMTGVVNAGSPKTNAR